MPQAVVFIMKKKVKRHQKRRERRREGAGLNFVAVRNDTVAKERDGLFHDD